MRTWSSLVVLAIVLFLSACQLTEPGTNVTVPPPSGITPIILTDTFPTPTLDTDITDEQGGETGPGGIATGAPAFGDIVFVRGSQIWTVGADSTNERAILILPDGVELNDVSVSPGGRFTAYLASGSLTILDAETGEQDTFSDPGSLAIDPLVWTPDASALYTSRLITDTISGLPARSQLWRIPLPVGPDPQLVTETEFTADGDVVPVLAVNDTILVIEVGRSEIGQQFLYNSISSAQDVIPLAEGFYVWDISTDGALKRGSLCTTSAVPSGSQPNAMSWRVASAPGEVRTYPPVPSGVKITNP